MNEHYLIGLAAILVTGILARWIAWRLRLPSILLLLIAGIVAGPVTGFLNPDELFGPMLTPFVSLSVGVILFEGGLSLDFRELRETGNVILRLITMGAAVTWALAAAAAWLILGFSGELPVLFGAILVVTGPTVVIPLLHHVRPKGQVAAVIRWEGILNDPVGALLAVLVYEAIRAGSLATQAQEAGLQLLYAALVGAGVGVAAALVLLVLIRYYLVPDELQNAFSLCMVVLAYTVSDHFQPESGFLATTLMGLVLANQRRVAVRHLVEFKENLRVLVISVLFIVLAARLTVDDLQQADWRAWTFLAVLIFLVRPAAVWISAVGSKLSAAEREFLAWMAPRGIVAAAVSSIFAERLAEAGVEGAERLVPVTFLVIIGTVTIYGLTAFPFARRLGLAEGSPQGALFVGAHSWAREMALALQKEGLRVVMADSNWYNVTRARMAGLPVHYGGILSEHVLEEIDLYGIGRLLALTSNEEANTLAALHFAGIFGRKEVYQLKPYTGPQATRKQVSPLHLSGRILFGENVTYDYLAQRFAAGATLKRSKLTEQFDWKAWQEKYGPEALLLFVVRDEDGRRRLLISAADATPRPKPGDVVIGLVEEKEQPPLRRASSASAGNREASPPKGSLP